MKSVPSESEHIPVLLEEFLTLSEGCLSFWDATLGAAGHIIPWLQRNKQSIAFGSDRDEQMLQVAQKKIEQVDLQDKVTCKYGNFSELPFQKQTFDLILLDLGISSLHFDTFTRGFSYRFDQELDMRLDLSKGEPIYHWLNEAPEKEISKVLFQYGEEPKARKISFLIVAARINKPIKSTIDLVDICKAAYHSNYKGTRHIERHPYVRTFQALRIFVNKELEHLEKALEMLPFMLKIHGRLAIISFHSLEDRLVKRAFLSLEKVLTPENPFHNEEQGDFKRLTKKPITASKKEIAMNPRSRSAKMRVLERIKVK